jgi:hypothetical protein
VTFDEDRNGTSSLHPYSSYSGETTFDEERERALKKMERRAAMMEFLGAMVKDLRVIYWPIYTTLVIVSFEGPVYQGYWSGPCFGNRGRHWDRRRKD